MGMAWVSMEKDQGMEEGVRFVMGAEGSAVGWDGKDRSGMECCNRVEWEVVSLHRRQRRKEWHNTKKLSGVGETA
jgi:hypothetical protein